jgi:hypothetical protein
MTAPCLRASSVLVLAAILSLAGCIHRVDGGSPGVWELRGAIVDATADHLRVRHKTGQVIELAIDDRTEVMRGERPETAGALRRGARVRVTVEPLTGGAGRARIVRVYGGGS